MWRRPIPPESVRFHHHVSTVEKTNQTLAPERPFIFLVATMVTQHCVLAERVLISFVTIMIDLARAKGYLCWAVVAYVAYFPQY